MTAAAIVPKTRFAEPAQRQFSVLRCLEWDVKFERLRRSGLRHERMNFDVAVGDQANFPARNVTRINDPELVTRAAAETLVTQFERLVIERRRVAPPGNAPALVSKIGQRRSQKGRVFLKARSADQMRLAERITQVVVETAW